MYLVFSHFQKRKYLISSIHTKLNIFCFSELNILDIWSNLTIRHKTYLSSSEEKFMDASSRGRVLEVASLGLSQPWWRGRASDDDFWHLWVSDDCWELTECILNDDRLQCLHSRWPSSTSLQSSSRVQHLRWLFSKIEFEDDTFSHSSLTSVNTESLLCDLEKQGQKVL